MKIPTSILLLLAVSHLAIGAGSESDVPKPVKVVGELSSKVIDFRDTPAKSVKVELHYINKNLDPLDIKLAGSLDEVVKKSKVWLMPTSSDIDTYLWGRDGSRLIVPYGIGFMYSYSLRYYPKVDGGTLIVRSVSGVRDTYKLSDLKDCTIRFRVVVGSDASGNELVLQSEAIDLAACFYSKGPSYPLQPH